MHSTHGTPSRMTLCLQKLTPPRPTSEGMAKYPAIKNSSGMRRMDVMIPCMIAKKPPACVSW